LKDDDDDEDDEGEQGRALVHTVMNLRVPQKVGNFVLSWVILSFSRRTLLHGVSYEREQWSALRVTGGRNQFAAMWPITSSPWTGTQSENLDTGKLQSIYCRCWCRNCRVINGR